MFAIDLCFFGEVYLEVGLENGGRLWRFILCEEIVVVHIGQ